jgi:hypothetical protein
VVAPQNYLELLRVLAVHGVEFVVVGGVAAVLEGVPISTLDLDVVASLEPSNRERLMAALTDLEARYLDPARRDLRPTVERLRGEGSHLFSTAAGRLGVLGKIGKGWRYEDLLERSRRASLKGMEILVLELAALVEVKELTGRDKDRAALPILRRALEIRRQRGEP